MDILILPFIACIALVGIHVYFGQSVIKRGIIFIDLALAQWAALGYLIGHYLHIENEILLFGMAFLFSSFSGIVITALKCYFSSVNFKEAIIGVMYILGGTLATTLISITGMEGYHLQEMLTGHLLFTSITEISSGIIIYILAALGLFFIKRNNAKISSIIQDIIFYTLFALVVTSSVKIAGILLVFSYLVMPILTGIVMTKNEERQISIGWIIGGICSLFGLGLSLLFDTPPSYCVILAMGICLFLGIIINRNSLKEL